MLLLGYDQPFQIAGHVAAHFCRFIRLLDGDCQLLVDFIYSRVVFHVNRSVQDSALKRQVEHIKPPTLVLLLVVLVVLIVVVVIIGLGRQLGL